MRLGLKWSEDVRLERTDPSHQAAEGAPVEHAVIVGVGLRGRAIASRLELIGVDACLVDFSPLNLHPLAQQGFRTVRGDARDAGGRERARRAQGPLAVVCVPEDEAARQIVAAIRALNADTAIVVRCRYQASADRARRAGASAVVSEEVEATGALLAQCERFVHVPG